MAKTSNAGDGFSHVAQLLQNLLAIELWRGGLSQSEIAKRLGVATGSVNKILKGVARELVVVTHSK